MGYLVYILRCRDDSYYVGWTEDLPGRLERHNSGRAASWTSSRLPVTLVYQESHATTEQAIRRERQIKAWSRAKKEALIQGDRAALKALSRCRASRPGARPEN